MKRLRLWWAKIVRWWVRPFPADFQQHEGTHRRVPIELVFFLAADGKVYHRRRAQDGDRRVDDDAIIAMVHTEYRWLVKQAKRSARIKKMVGR